MNWMQHNKHKTTQRRRRDRLIENNKQKNRGHMEEEDSTIAIHSWISRPINGLLMFRSREKVMDIFRLKLLHFFRIFFYESLFLLFCHVMMIHYKCRVQGY